MIYSNLFLYNNLFFHFLNINFNIFIDFLLVHMQHLLRKNKCLEQQQRKTYITFMIDNLQWRVLKKNLYAS